MPAQSAEVTTPEIDERALVSRAIRDDRSAHDAIFNLYAPGIYRLAFRMSGDADLASDMTQDTFIKAFDSLATFRHESSLRTWIHSIGVSVILASLRTIKRRESKLSSIVVADSAGKHDSHGDTVLRSHLYSAIDSLPVGYRAVFVMYEIEGYSHAEIAAHLGVEITTSQGQLFRARAKLRELLNEFRMDMKS